jgi:tetratricopeptide (TPR) repeat protein
MRRLVGWGWVAFALASGTAWAQSAPVAKSCSPQHLAPGPAEVALIAGKHAEAVALYQDLVAKNPDSVGAKVGLVRALLSDGKLADALELATRTATAAPSDARAQDALGEVRYRRGEVGDAANAFNAAQAMDPCLARVHQDIARYQNLAGNFQTAVREIDLAHKLSPDDPSITREFGYAHSHPMTPDEEISFLTERMSKDGVTDEQRKATEESIKRVKARNNGNCEMVQPVETAKLNLETIRDEHGADAEVGGVALDMNFNGKRKRLQVETGASGLTITKAAAASAGLVTEAESRMFGVGDQGSRRSFVTHVEKLTLGGMEFHNCEVEVLDRQNIFPVDGLIGTDVFARWVVTLDIPSREIRLSPLPKRPGDEESAEPMRLEIHGASGNGQDAKGVAHDRFIAPEMEDWSKVYRRGHDLIVPAVMNNLPPKLLILDSGAFQGSVTPPVAQELGHVAASNLQVVGISGQTARVEQINQPVMVMFSRVRQPILGLPVFDISGVSRSAGVEISGFIGFKTLRELILSIDYRDNLVKVVYDPKHGFHATGM